MKKEDKLRQIAVPLKTEHEIAPTMSAAETDDVIALKTMAAETEDVTALTTPATKLSNYDNHCATELKKARKLNT